MRKLLVLSVAGLALVVALPGQTKIDFLSQIRNFNAFPLTQNTANTNGGYISFKPVTYNPYDATAVCYDIYLNPVQQPVVPSGQPAFATNDLVMWNSLSPAMPYNAGIGTGLVQKVLVTSPASTAAGPCGTPLPVNTDYGLNTNGYFFGRGGLATDLPFYNSIQSLQGGVTANSFTAGTLYPAGTVTTTGTLSTAAYLGGHTDTGHSVGPPAAGTIATVTNPFSGAEGLVAGMIYYDDALGCERVYSGTAWGCIGGPGSIPSGPVYSLQINNPIGTFYGDINATYNPTTGVMGVCTALGGVCTATSGFNAQAFSSTATGSAVAFTTGPGTFTINGNGNANFQVLAATAPNTTTAAIYGKVGYIQSDIGFAALPATATAYNAVQAPGGGMQALSFTAVQYVQSGNSAGTPAVVGTDNFHAGALNYNTVSNCEQVYDGTAWSCLSTGGATAPGGADGNVQVNSVGSFGGSDNLKVAAQTLIATATSSVTPAIYGKTGYIQSDIGFDALPATATAYNAIQAPGGGMQALSFTAARYVQTGNTAGIPTVVGSDSFNAGALNYNTNANCEQVYNGATWACIGGSTGVTSFNTRTGAVTLLAADVAAVEQDLRPSATPIFSSVTALNVFNCAATGLSPCITQSGGFWSVNGQGDFLGQSVTVGSNNGSVATGGRGAVINKTGATISMFAYDSGGVCGIGTGEAAPGIVCSSDQRLKTPGISVADGLDAILQLRPVTFNWLGSGARGVGFIAQEVQKVLPNLVTVGPGPDAFLMLSEEGIIPYLVRAIQQQQVEIDALKGGVWANPSAVGHMPIIGKPMNVFSGPIPTGNAYVLHDINGNNSNTGERAYTIDGPGVATDYPASFTVWDQSTSSQPLIFTPTMATPKKHKRK